jgi:predicted amidophosphoribosyltransferase
MRRLPLLDAIVNLVYPNEYLACGARLQSYSHPCLCEQCVLAIEEVGPNACPRCAAVFRYNDVARAAVHGLKFHHILSPVRWMASELADKVQRMEWIGEVDLIVPVPLHWTRRLARRFN